MRAPSLVVEAFKRLDLGLSVLALLGVTSASAYFRIVPLWFPFVALVVYGLMWSIYDTFDEVRATNQTLQRQVTTSRKRRATLDLLGRYHAKGQELARDNPRVEEMLEATAEEISEWGEGVYRLIRAAYGSGRAEIFLSGKDSGYKEVWLQERLAQLVRLMEQTSEMELRPDFDPEDFDHQDQEG